MSRRNSGDLKPGRKERFAKLPTEMKERIGEFELGLHGVRESTRENYLARIEWFGVYLVQKGLKSFEAIDRKDIDLFLYQYKNPSTKNLFIQVFRSLYRNVYIIK